MENAKWAFFLCFQFPVFCCAEDLPDPTRPPAAIAVPVAASGVADSQPAGLQSIIISRNRRAAIIDGETVELGKKHGDARLIEVNEGNVVLQNAQGRQMLTLFPDVKISQVKPQSPVSRVQAVKKKPVPHDEKLLMGPLAIPLAGKTTATKRPVMSGHPKEED
ncbi:MAG: hypothetical protein WC208_02880 [Gallionella sp.]|jgi:hypothetical protein